MINKKYWLEVLKRILMVILTILLMLGAFKLAVFYIPFVIAYIISLIIEPVIQFFMKVFKLKRKLSVAISLLIVITIFLVLLTFIVMNFISETSNFFNFVSSYIEEGINFVTNYINGIDFSKFQIDSKILEPIQSSLINVVGTFFSWLSHFLTSMIGFVASVPKMFVSLIITILSVIYLSFDKGFLKKTIKHNFPEDWITNVSRIVTNLKNSLGKYLKAYIILIIIDFVEVFIGISLLNVLGFNIEYPLLISIGVGLVSAIPVLGAGSALIPWAIITLLFGNVELCIALVILYGIMCIIRQFTEPNIVSKKIGINPIITLIAMFTGFKIFGIAGMIFGPIILLIMLSVFENIFEDGVFKNIFDKDLNNKEVIKGQESILYSSYNK